MQPDGSALIASNIFVRDFARTTRCHEYLPEVFSINRGVGPSIIMPVTDARSVSFAFWHADSADLLDAREQVTVIR